MRISVYESDVGFQDREIDPSQVVEFGFLNVQCLRRNAFRKWNTKAYLRLKDREDTVYTNFYAIKVLRRMLQGKFTTHRTMLYANKDGQEKTAVNWSHKIRTGAHDVAMRDTFRPHRQVPRFSHD